MCERVSDVQCTMNCEKNESFSRVRCQVCYRLPLLRAKHRHQRQNLNKRTELCTLALRLRCFLRGVWRDRSFGAVGTRRDGAGRVDGFGRRRCSRRRQSRRFSLRVRARSVILRRDTMKSSLLGLVLLTTSSRAILPVSVTLVEEQG